MRDQRLKIWRNVKYHTKECINYLVGNLKAVMSYQQECDFQWTPSRTEVHECPCLPSSFHAVPRFLASPVKYGHSTSGSPTMCQTKHEQNKENSLAQKSTSDFHKVSLSFRQKRLQKSNQTKCFTTLNTITWDLFTY